jgi:SAM-dependent methyltransferase
VFCETRDHFLRFSQQPLGAGLYAHRRPVYGHRVADLIFEHPRLAQIYDALEPDRADLDLYARLVTEFGARTVLDIGSGTGTLACLLAQRGVEVVAVDPARASLDVARSKPDAHRVRGLHSDATALPPLRADLATMTGNVAQVFSVVPGYRPKLATRGDHAALSPLPWSPWQQG